MKPTLTVTSDFTKEFNDIVKQFKRDAVLVGIPELDSKRKDDDEKPEPINNAALLAINEFGSPIQNIPARPVMSIGIRNAQEEIAETMLSPLLLLQILTMSSGDVQVKPCAPLKFTVQVEPEHTMLVRLIVPPDHVTEFA